MKKQQTFEELYRNPDIQICKEITDWDTPNHIYYINQADKLVGYKSVNGQSKVFQKPLQFSRARRKFSVLKDYGKPESKYRTTLKSCTCKGFMFRKICKHVNELRSEHGQAVG